MSKVDLISFKAISNGALKSKELPSRLKLLDWGKNDSTKGPVTLNEEVYDIFDTNQKKWGRDRVPLDFDHCTVPGSENFAKGQPKSIAAYGNPRIIPGEGMYLENVEWTEMGKKYAKNYEDLSPALIIKEGKILGLESAGLTPTGAIEGLTFFSATSVKSMIEKLDDSTEVFAAKNKEDEDDNDGDEDDQDGEVCTYDKDVHKKHLEEYDQEDHFSKYGDVEYADQENHKYPVDTEAHARAALAYINMPKNAKKYSGDKLSQIKSRIKTAAEKHGIEVSDKGETTTKAMSSEALPNAYKNTEPKETTSTKLMIDELVKAAPKKLGMRSPEEARKIILDLLAKWDGESSEDGEHREGTITNKENSTIKGFAAQIEVLTQTVKTLKDASETETKRHTQTERESIVALSAQDGKVIPLSADSIAAMPVNLLKELVDKLPKGKVPTKSTAVQTFSSNRVEGLKGLELTKVLFQEQADALLARS